MLYTIVIPYRDRAAFLPETLASLPPEAAIILVDNGSTDDSAALCRDFAATRPNVRCISQPSGGAAAARNAGLAAVETEWVYFFDSDDVFSAPVAFFQWPDVASYDALDVICLPTQMERISATKSQDNERNSQYSATKSQDNESNSQYSANKAQDNESNSQDTPSTTRLIPRDFRPTASPADQILISMLATQTMLLRTAFLRRIGGWNETLPVWNDWELGLRVLLNAPRLQWVATSAPYHRIRLHAASLTGSRFSERATERFLALSAAESLINASPNGVPSSPDAKKLLRALDLRRGILCGHLLREHYALTAADKPRTLRARLLMHYVRLGLRGAWRIARLLY